MVINLQFFLIQNTSSSPSSLFSDLSDMLNQSHPLYQLADRIDWGNFETAFEPLYCQDNGRPGKPIRLMCGLLILKHFRKRIGEDGIGLIFQESIRVNNEDDDKHHHDTAFIDSAVQKKNIT